jgi:hypothetical protein|tara:strand:- start:3640 stop:4032 length:393 start_codon:yes stop_codon:yes gene_type:complete
LANEGLTYIATDLILYITVRKKERNMQIEVIHSAFEDEAEHVANVAAPQADVMEALEYAFRYTNNVEGSWSMKVGGDSNDDVEVVKPLYKGRGHRSTSVGDHMRVGDQLYIVAGMGFKPVTEIKMQEHCI